MRGGGGEWLGFGKETGDGDGEWRPEEPEEPEVEEPDEPDP